VDVPKELHKTESSCIGTWFYIRFK